MKVNVQAEADIASRYGIRGIPVIKFFCEGKEVGEIVGFVPENCTKEPSRRDIQKCTKLSLKYINKKIILTLVILGELTRHSKECADGQKPTDSISQNMSPQLFITEVD